MIEVFHEAGVITHSAVPAKRLPYPYYRDCLLKLHVFGLTEYQRIVYVDADAIPLRGFEPLFSLSLDRPIAAPLAYWLENPMKTSCMMVIEPDPELYARAEAAARRQDKAPVFDMDLINAVFHDQICDLPDGVMLLDSEWIVKGGPRHLPEGSDTRQDVFYVHFSAQGKPWSHSPSRVRKLWPDADETFYVLRETWWQAMKEVRAQLPVGLRIWIPVSRALDRATRFWPTRLE